MRAAVLHGPDDLRVEEVDEPAGEVLVRVEAATACGTDVKMLRHGHRVLGPYPSRFGHETAGGGAGTGGGGRRAPGGGRVPGGVPAPGGGAPPVRGGPAAVRPRDGGGPGGFRRGDRG